MDQDSVGPTKPNDQDVVVAAQQLGAQPEWGAYAPGRINLIGDHTDYGGGWCMPVAIDRGTWAFACHRAPGQREISLYSDRISRASVTLPERAEPSPNGDWADYLRGVRWGYQQAGISIQGVSIFIGGDLPLGSGQSSSASLSLCFAHLIEAITGKQLEPVVRAKLCQTAECEFVGVPCGILDQFAISFGQHGHALLLDCQKESVSAVKMADSPHFYVINSMVNHQLSDGGYADRYREVRHAERLLGKSLRNAQIAELEDITDAVIRQRARHVVTENQRVTRFAHMLAQGDLLTAGALMTASHTSLAQDFAVSCDEVDWLVNALLAAGAYGARMTGGGFGGSVVILGAPNLQQIIEIEVLPAFESRWGQRTSVQTIQASSGARAIDSTMIKQKV